MPTFDEPLAPVRAMTSSFAAEITTEHSSTMPQPGRVYDAYLGGATNLEVDRAFAEQQIKRHPRMRLIARENRYWQIRATQFIRDAGVRQFLDLGSGLPDLMRSVHHISDSGSGDITRSRVIYVDNDPVIAAQAFGALSDAGLLGRHNVIHGDIRQVDRIWQVAVEGGMFDPRQRVGVIAAALLHFVTDDVGKDLFAPDQAMSYLRERCAPGSYLAISHGTLDEADALDRAEVTEVAEDYTARSTAPVQLRDRAEIARFFGDWPLVDPGLTWTALWRPDRWSPALDDPTQVRILAGVAHHRASVDDRSLLPATA
jgi:hypothetical protein